ncbi:MAG: S9 family peptidase [Thermaerobacter sp.]|nr:S9 family peptidase [Thermaerobacter sp.]
MPIPPKAPKKPHPHTLHGDTRPDDYYWLRDRSNPEVIAYLEAENYYFDQVMTPLAARRDTLYRDMVDRIPETEAGPPAQHGAYYYYWRVNPGQEYRTYYRKQAKSRADLGRAPEEVVLDTNALANAGQYMDVSDVQVSPDDLRVLYLENHDGTDRYTLHVKEIATGRFVGEPVQDVFICGSATWDKSGNDIYYLGVDAAQRPCRLHRRRLADSTDILLYEESDITFELDLAPSRSHEYLFLTSRSKSSSEVRYLALGEPDAPLRLFTPRSPNVLYSLEHWNDQLLILTNEGAENFQLLAVPLDNPDPALARPVIPYAPERYWQLVLPFGDGLVIAGREGGLSQIWLYQAEKLQRLPWDEPIYSVAPSDNLAYDAPDVLLEYQSMVTPRTQIAVEIRSGRSIVLAQDAVRLYDPSQYQQKQRWVTAKDGAKIPVSLVAKREVWSETPAPTILYGYGSYGANSDPEFIPELLPLLDRGVIYAIAHIRGGSEMGFGWYQDGKVLTKRNTFTDFLSVAEHLIDEGFTTPDLFAIEGLSAGGLLMGAVLNMRPDLFRVAAPGVPFVDVINSMMDASIPLTSLEWDEWGNPANPEQYSYMKSYSPYDNVTAKEHPHMFVTAGLNDPRVGYFEPAKWVARLRATKTDNNQLVLKTHMGSGHFGSSGRLAHLVDEAEKYAFILDKLGVKA